MASGTSLILFMLCFMGILFILSRPNTNLNSFKSRTVGDGQYGTAKFATKKEIYNFYHRVMFTPELWRQGKNLPVSEGIIVGCETVGNKTYALIDDGDVHALMIGAAGVGKTSFFLYPNLEYACACGMSFLTTDTKGDLYRNYGSVAKKFYGYDVTVIDLRNPLQSDSWNMLNMVNHYMDLYKCNREKINYLAKAEKYSKIIAKTIINTDNNEAGYGQNQFFYDAAEGLLASIVLIISEFAEKKERHIISVFKIIQDLMNQNESSDKTMFKELMDSLPNNHRARWLAGSALHSPDQSMQSVLSTALARLNVFLDAEMEQILCRDSSLDIEKFCKEKSAIFLVMPEEDNTKYFLISLLVQQVYREILSYAGENKSRLSKRVMFYLDELGTLNKIPSIEMMFSASRSRGMSIVAMIQSIAQLNNTYGEHGAEIIIDNCQLTIFGGFAPNSKTAEMLSKNLGNRTVLSGSVSIGKNETSRSLQMTERQLMTSDELKIMKRGDFIVERNGMLAMKAKFKLFTKWGIQLKNDYTIPEKSLSQIVYADIERILDSISKEYKTNTMDDFQEITEHINLKDFLSKKQGFKLKEDN